MIPLPTMVNVESTKSSITHKYQNRRPCKHIKQPIPNTHSVPPKPIFRSETRLPPSLLTNEEQKRSADEDAILARLQVSDNARFLGYLLH